MGSAAALITSIAGAAGASAGTAATIGTATVGAASIGAAAYGTHTALEMHRAQSTAEQKAKEQSEAFKGFEFEMPSFDFELPSAPPVAAPPAPPAPPPTASTAATRVAQEGQRDKARRRTLSLFASSPEKQGRQSTILTSSVGAPGTPTVRQRQLGGVSLLGGGV